MRQLAFVPFSAFSPDGPAHGPGLDRAENVIPAHGGYRSLEKASVQSSLAFTNQPFGEDRPTGLFVHIFQQSRTGSWLRPSGDSSAGAWVPSEGDDLWAMLDEEVAADADRIIAGGAPSAVVCKIALADPVATPAVDTGHILRWRYAVLGSPSSSWSVKVELMQGAAVVGGGSPVTETKVGTSNVDFVSSELTLTTTQAATITDYTDLFLRFTATVPGAVQIVRPDADDSVAGWTTHAGASTNLYQAIDETVASDADYIRTAALVPAGSQTYRARLSNPGGNPFIFSGHIVRYRYFSANAGMTLKASLKMGATVIHEETHAAIAAGSWIDGSFTLTSPEAEEVTDYNNLFLELVASYPSSVASTETQEAVPASDITVGSWTRSDTGLGTNVYQVLDEGSAGAPDGLFANYAAAVVGGVPAAATRYEALLGTLDDPQLSTGHVVTYRATVAAGTNLTVRLLQGAATIASWDHGTIASGVEQVQTLSAAQADSITSYADLRIRFEWTDAYKAQNISYAYMSAPAPRRLRVSFTEFQIPSQARAEVSWSELEVPASDAEYRGDVPTIYLGKKPALYVVDTIGFEDVSIAAGYGAGGTKPGGWCFTSWGNDTIATNYTDPVQIRRDQTGLFANMITSTLKPKARFVMVVRNHVVLLDINLTGHAADEVWWSAFEDETDFDPALATQSDFQPLRSTQGQIMGGVGGEYGVIFKRNAIHLMTATGTSSVFRFDEVSRGIGTPFPRSIVRAEGMIYFWDGSSFRRTTGFEQPERVGSDVLSRFLTDARFEEHALRVFEPENILEEDQAMVSAYDSSAGVITWSYTGTNDETALTGPVNYRKSRKVHYNSSLDMWSFSIEPEPSAEAGSMEPPPPPLWVSDLAQVPNVTSSEVHLLKGTIASYYQAPTVFGANYSGFTGWMKWSGANTYEVTFRTKRLTLGDDDNRSARVTGVVPIFKIAGETETLPVHLSITMEAANDPRFLVNVRSETYSTPKANEYGRFPHQLEGKWFVFTVTVPEMESRALTSFVGLYVEWEPGGQA